MSEPHLPPSTGATAAPPVQQPAGSGEPSVGTLLSDLSQQIPDLVRSELRLAQVEMTEKGKRAGIGLGMFSAAGLLGFFGLAVLIATAVLALDLVLPAWAAALIVAVVLLAAAAALGLVGKSKVAEATPPKPERAIESIKDDVAAVKGDHR